MFRKEENFQKREIVFLTKLHPLQMDFTFANNLLTLIEITAEKPQKNRNAFPDNNRH